MEKVKAGEQRQSGYLYFVKGMDLQVYKTKMARGRKKAKKTSKKTSKKKRR